MRIRLAAWYGDRAPGEVLDVDEATVKALTRDGLVAGVLADQPAAPPAEPERQAAVSPEPARRRR
ncbi:hypothetical protein ABZX85_23395 [Streptomyces sp. NPDC004539]|uniref:hypothetical protein n=1 Tax=Streptomyces sp. NPDC004539 TaxID=3154280 RepID=UPI0033A51350